MIKSKKYTESLLECFDTVVNKDKIQNCSFLITGASGLIGSAVAQMLLEANDVNSLSLDIYLAARNTDKLHDRFERWHGKYTPVNYEANSGFELEYTVNYIIHCAGISDPVLYSTKPVETILTSVIGTNHILDYAKRKGVDRVLYVSSSEVYGNRAGMELYKENDYANIDILNPRSCYPTSKRMCENLCVCYGREYGVDSVFVRPGHIYGPTITDKDSRAHAQFVRDVLKDQDIVMKSPGLQLRSYCYVLDCATAILTVLLNGSSWESYNISNNDSVVTIREFAEMHAIQSGKHIIFSQPNDVEAAGYNMMTCSALESEKLYCLGWKGLYNLERGVKETIEVLREQ